MKSKRNPFHTRQPQKILQIHVLAPFIAPLIFLHFRIRAESMSMDAVGSYKETTKSSPAARVLYKTMQIVSTPFYSGFVSNSHSSRESFHFAQRQGRVSVWGGLAFILLLQGCTAIILLLSLPIVTLPILIR